MTHEEALAATRCALGADAVVTTETGASQRGEAQEISLQLQRYTITSDRNGQQGSVLGERVVGQ